MTSPSTIDTSPQASRLPALPTDDLRRPAWLITGLTQPVLAVWLYPPPKLLKRCLSVFPVWPHTVAELAAVLALADRHAAGRGLARLAASGAPGRARGAARRGVRADRADGPRRAGHPASRDALDLRMATLITILGELCFTLYSNVNDVFHLLGRADKVIAYVCIHRAVFVVGVREPCEQLRVETAERRYAERRRRDAAFLRQRAAL